MTTWDKIYRDYNNGGEDWATLSENIHPLFKQFLNKSNFEFKHVLDIGCGTGKYLRFLADRGFKTDGVDSSETAVKMAKSVLDKKTSNIKKADMFKLRITKNSYDLIISISTIHHGAKKDVQNLINKIHSALANGGKIFITLPDFESTKKWNTFYHSHKKSKNGAFYPTSGPEKGLAHSFYAKAEVQKLFAKFSGVKISLDKIGRWVVQASK
ncbi:MAG: class I SAM-dependent methyltransferase [bacterium]|nr:class I SAM-dependent methyltransferase [bacterium]